MNKITRRELVRRLSAIYGAGAVGSFVPLRGLAQEIGAQEADATTAAMVAEMEPGTVLWDGASGVSNTYYNYGAKLPWKNAGGDWIDAANTPQGSSRFATITWSVAGVATASVTNLVRRWYASGNKGIFLKCLDNAATVASRTHSDGSSRPVILATLSDGATITLPCTGSGVCNSTTLYPLAGQVHTIQTFASMVMQFALTPLNGRTVSSATLRIVTTRLFGGSVNCALFELDLPKFFNGGTPTLGLAARYTRDEGLENDPQVYFTTQFDEPNWQQKHFPVGELASDSTVVGDPQLGTPALRVSYATGKFSPCTLDHMWTSRVPGIPKTNAAGTLKTYQHIHPTQYDALNNQDCPDEVYFRYYLKLASNYQCAVDGKKLPGLAGRYGYWNWSGADKGYYQSVNGNGGSRTQGTKILSSHYPGGHYYSGWSMRHQAIAGPADANPYKAWVATNTYAYHVGQAGFFGDVWRWGTPETGWIAFEPERWYCIEQYIKVNSLRGPFDALGNGIGNPDGIIRGWIDGVLVLEKRDIVFRRHPAIRIDEVWMNHYHGGTTPPESPHGFSMANLVVADAYIGPMTRGPVTGTPPPPVTQPPPTTGTGPAWMQGKPINQWIAIPGTEMANAPLTAQIAARLTDSSGRNLGYGDPRRGIFRYSGGALKKSGSEMLVFGGGAGGAWAGNDVRGLRLEDAAPTWRTRINPAPAPTVRPRSSAPSAYMADGASPASRHSYWGTQFIDSQDAFMSFGCVHSWTGGQFYTVDGAHLATGKWKAPGSYPNIPDKRGWDGNWACKHPVTEDVYVSGARSVSRWQASSNKWSNVVQRTRTDVDRGVAAIDPTGNGTLLRVGAFGTVLSIDLGSGSATEGKLVGPLAGSIRIGAYYAAGIVYDPNLKKFVLFQDDGHLYTIDRATTSTWQVERMALSGAAPQTLHSSGGYMPAIWGRMQYVPNLKGICILQAYDRPAYFVRTA
jgi:hypothetical protein